MNGPHTRPAGVLAGNLFAGLDPEAREEAFDGLLSVPGVRIERIVSTGQSTPPGVWYDQAGAEWVLVVVGSAEILIEGEPAPRRLAAGDHLLLPARCRHRVESTARGTPTVWLAVHLPHRPGTPSHP